MRTSKLTFVLVPMPNSGESEPTALLLEEDPAKKLHTLWVTTDRMDTLAVLNRCEISDHLLEALRLLERSTLPRESSEESVQATGLTAVLTGVWCAQRSESLSNGPDGWEMDLPHLLDLTTVPQSTWEAFEGPMKNLPPDMTMTFVDEDGTCRVEIFYSREQALAALMDHEEWIGPGSWTHADRVQTIEASNLPEGSVHMSQTIFGLAANQIAATTIMHLQQQSEAS